MKTPASALRSVIQATTLECQTKKKNAQQKADPDFPAGVLMSSHREALSIEWSKDLREFLGLRADEKTRKSEMVRFRRVDGRGPGFTVSVPAVGLTVKGAAMFTILEFATDDIHARLDLIEEALECAKNNAHYELKILEDRNGTVGLFWTGCSFRVLYLEKERVLYYIPRRLTKKMIEFLQYLRDIAPRFG